MSLCAACGIQLTDGEALCRHHSTGADDGWAASNRIMCDFIHRGVVPARAADDEKEICATLAEVA
jgi:hypothetical protein